MARKQKRKPARQPAAAVAIAEATAPGPRWLAWLVPNLPMVVAIAAVIYSVKMYQSPSSFFGDADPGWHIRSGDWIMFHRQAPVADPFSFQETGHGWFAWEWLADVVMALAHRSLGLSGVVWMYTLVLAAATWTWFRLHWKVGGNFLLACMMVPLLISATQVHWLARPHLASFVLLPATLLCLEAMPQRFGWRQALIAFAGAALWANLHGSFPLGIALAALYGVSALAGNPNRARSYFLAAACMLAGTFVNPYGWRLHAHVIEYLFLRPELRENIQEWQKYDFERHYSRLQVGLMFGISAAGMLLALVQRRFAHALVIALVLYTGFAAVRGVPLTALVALPLAGAGFTRLLDSRKLFPGLLRLGAGFRQIDAGFHGAALVPVLALALLAWLRTPAVAARTGFLDGEYPVRAAEAIAKLPATARLFAAPQDGGYLIYRFEGQRKIWLDSRTDYFGPQPYRIYNQLSQTRGAWDRSLDQLGFTHVLIRLDEPLAPALDQRHWKSLYRDDRFVLLEKPAWNTL